MRGSMTACRPIYSLLYAGNEPRVSIEVLMQLDVDHVRGVALNPTQGLARGMAVEDTGGPLKVPVGKGILSRMFDVFGNAIDRQPAPTDVEWRTIHRDPPSLANRPTKRCGTARRFRINRGLFSATRSVELTGPHTARSRISTCGEFSNREQVSLDPDRHFPAAGRCGSETGLWQGSSHQHPALLAGVLPGDDSCLVGRIKVGRPERRRRHRRPVLQHVDRHAPTETSHTCSADCSTTRAI